MRVELITYTPDPERVVASAARLCYSDVRPSDNLGSMTMQDISKFISKLIGMGHESPLEHVSFTFTVEGVSRSLSHQLVRHRIASYSQKSQRYVSEDAFGYIVPGSISSNLEASRLFSEAMSYLNDVYIELKSVVPREDARYVLPNACETNLMVTMNARSLLHFFRVRCCHRAQWEIRELAEEMLLLVRQVAPVLFSVAGRPCEFGECPEGELSCGLLG